MIQQHDSMHQFPLRQTPLSVVALTAHWKKAKQELKKLQKESRDLRYRSYKEILEAYECDIYNPESARRAKIIKSTIRTEKCREMYRKIRLSVKSLPEQSGGINRHTNSPDRKESTQGYPRHDRSTSIQCLSMARHTPRRPRIWMEHRDRPFHHRRLSTQLQ